MNECVTVGHWEWWWKVWLYWLIEMPESQEWRQKSMEMLMMCLGGLSFLLIPVSDSLPCLFILILMMIIRVCLWYFGQTNMSQRKERKKEIFAFDPSLTLAKCQWMEGKSHTYSSSPDQEGSQEDSFASSLVTHAFETTWWCLPVSVFLSFDASHASLTERDICCEWRDRFMCEKSL